MIKRFFNLKSARGFTMVEAMMGVSIGLMATLGGYVLIASMNQNMAGNSEMLKAQQEARVILERITREMREADSGKVLPDSMEDWESDYIIFYTPRKDDQSFVVGSNGKPRWQKAIRYRFDRYSNRLMRDQIYISDITGVPYFNTYHTEVVSENVEKLSFKREKDMIILAIRTFGDKNKMKNMAVSYSDFNTRIKMRN